MNHKLKMIARKLFYGGATKGLYEKLASIQSARREKLSDEDLVQLRYREKVGGGVLLI